MNVNPVPEGEVLQPITRVEDLAQLIKAVEITSEVCLDTEADSMHHYFEKVCLLQFTLPHGNPSVPEHYLVDPLAQLDLKPLFDALKEKPLILHGSDYDLRLLKSTYDFSPIGVFDTMLAARLAGHPALGLDALVLRYTGLEMDHGAQKADWSQRPLSSRLLRYAVDDTRHLPLIAQKLREELGSLGRTEWHRQQCSQLVEAAATARPKDVSEAWRIKGSFDMDRQCLAILREIWKWRDSEARHWDRPPFMVWSNDKMIDLAYWARQNPNGNLEQQGPQLPPRWPTRRLRALLTALQTAWSLPPEEWPEPPARGKRPPFDAYFIPRIEKLKAARDALARDLKLEPSILAPNAVLEAIAGRNPTALGEFVTIEKWLPWQGELLGKNFIEALASATPSPPRNNPSPSRRSEEQS